MMKVLVVGGGGREHALVWKIAQSKEVDKIYCAPGNYGISTLAECVDISATSIDELLDFALSNDIDLTVVGPDNTLALGIVDLFNEKGLRIFGPDKSAARMESSKVFSKTFMKKYGIPTAAYETFDSYDEASAYLDIADIPIVVKADGLALGKGVYVCNTKEEAHLALKEIMEDKKFGSSGESVVIEEFLSGNEVSILAFSDGKTIVPMVSAQDYKKIYDGDKGPNTGGMGSIAPLDKYDEAMAELTKERIIIPTIKALNEEGITYKGVLYFGLILTDIGPKVIEYNSRFGDPEAQVVLPLLDSDIIPILEACIDGNLNDCEIKWKEKAAVCVILASAGYPGDSITGYQISGLDENETNDVIVFHAATKIKDKEIVTNGGRVLAVTTIAEDTETARNIAYKRVNEIDFNGKQYRRDIGDKR